MQHDLGAEDLAHRDLTLDRDVIAEGRERQPLGPDADDHVVGALARRPQRGGAERDLEARGRAPTARPPTCATSAAKKFIVGVPKNPPTKRFAGRS